MPNPKNHPSSIEIQDFQYDLPDDRIARFPLKERDQSKLLIYRDGQIKETIYQNIAGCIPQNSLLLFNEAKVIHARLYFQKETGGKIEVFCLEPDQRYPDITSAMLQEREVYWKCLLKGAGKWKDDSELTMKAAYTNEKNEEISFFGKARKIAKEGNSFIIHIQWEGSDGQAYSFSEFLEHAGKIPIPPYLKRKAEESDEERYQTIFAEKEGSVAAPTASLHFTSNILSDLAAKSIRQAKLTLHVGAGTFMPVKSEKMENHEMHSEWIEVGLDALKMTVQQIKEGQKIIAVGTTSARTLESLYWIGVQILRNEWNAQKANGIAVSQWYPYQRDDEFSGLEAVEALIKYLETNQLDRLITRTQIIIAPGYHFKLLDGLITNFHQPASTLLLMIAALVGVHWKNIYDYALNNHFRFLSYGDGSLLWKS